MQIAFEQTGFKKVGYFTGENQIGTKGTPFSFDKYFC